MKNQPAFPRPVSIDPTQGTLPDGDRVIDQQDGMTLRDYFAAKNMQAILMTGDDGWRPTLRPEHMAQDAKGRYGKAIEEEGGHFYELRGGTPPAAERRYRCTVSFWHQCASDAYEIADAMIAASKEGKVSA